MIVRGRGGDVELRAFAGATGHMFAPRAGEGSVSVSNSSVLGVPAFYQGARLVSAAVAKLDLAVWRGDGWDRQRVTTTQQARLLADPTPLQSPFEWKETLEASLTIRNNAFVWCTPGENGSVAEMVVLHPDQVGVVVGADGEKSFQVAVGAGFVDPVGHGRGFYSVGEDVILHIKGFGGGGLWVAPSPVELFRSTLATSLQQSEYEAALYARGASSRVVILYPGDVPQEKAQQWRDMWTQTYEGAANAGKAAMLSGGASIQQISMTPADAEFVKSRQSNLGEVARIIGLRASLLDSDDGSGSTPLSPEHEAYRHLEYDLAGRLCRISDALRKRLFRGRRDYPGFDTNRVIRADIATESRMLVSEVQAGILLADEARARRGLGPLPDGAGMIPQLVPVGGAPNPNQPPPTGEVEEKSRREVVFEREVIREVSAINVSVPERAVTLNLEERAAGDPPVVHVHVPEQAAPIVNVAAPIVSPTPLEVHVEAPVVKVAAPKVTVENVIPSDRTITVKRDAFGNIESAEVVDS